MSPRGLCERSSSTKRVKEALQERKKERKKNEERGQRKERRGKQTQGSRECGEIGVGEGERGDIFDGGELHWDGGGKN